MTEDRIFKNKVKEVAELNGLTYNNAKKAVIELNKIIEAAKDENDDSLSVKQKELINNYLEVKDRDEDSNDDLSFPMKRPLFISDKKDSYRSLKLIERDGFHIKRIQLTADECPLFVDMKPLNNGVRKILYSDTVKTKTLKLYEEEIRVAYFSLVEDFGEENSYFVDKHNFFTQMPKLLRTIEEHDDKTELLVGIVSFRINENDKISMNQRRTCDELFARLNELIAKKKVFLITDRIEKEYFGYDVQSREYVSAFGYGIRLENKNKQFKYYPYNKKHGGSFYKRNNKKVLGHVVGEPYFAESHITLIETDDETIIEDLAKINNDEKRFIHWTCVDDMLPYLYRSNIEKLGMEYESQNSKRHPDDGHPDKHLGYSDYLKIDFDMTKEMIDAFVRSVESSIMLYLYSSDDADNVKIIIEANDVYDFQEFFKKLDKKEYYYIKTKTYDLTNGYLYGEEIGEISTYKV